MKYEQKLSEIIVLKVDEIYWFNLKIYIIFVRFVLL